MIRPMALRPAPSSFGTSLDGLAMGRAVRLQAEFTAHGTFGMRRGAGLLVEISRAGATIHSAAPAPPLGASVSIRTRVSDGYAIDLVGRMSHLREGGFSIDFLWFNPDLLDLLDAISARGHLT